jgi:hypothetical protein
MRGDQLARELRLIRATKISSKGLNVAEIPTSDVTQGSGQNRESFKNLFQMLGWAFLLWGVGRQSE